MPTTLTVRGTELTVKVDFHNSGFVFPIVAGEGWETSYTVPVVVTFLLLGWGHLEQTKERQDRHRWEIVSGDPCFGFRFDRGRGLRFSAADRKPVADAGNSWILRPLLPALLPDFGHTFGVLLVSFVAADSE